MYTENNRWHRSNNNMITIQKEKKKQANKETKKQPKI